MQSKAYEKKSRIYTEHIGVRVEPELKQKIECLRSQKEVADILRDGIRAAIEKVYSEVFPVKTA